MRALCLNRKHDRQFTVTFLQVKKSKQLAESKNKNKATLQKKVTDTHNFLVDEPEHCIGKCACMLPEFWWKVKVRENE